MWSSNDVKFKMDFPVIVLLVVLYWSPSTAVVILSMTTQNGTSTTLFDSQGSFALFMLALIEWVINTAILCIIAFITPSKIAEKLITSVYLDGTCSQPASELVETGGVLVSRD
jgi:hypothetical protein